MKSKYQINEIEMKITKNENEKKNQTTKKESNK